MTEHNILYFTELESQCTFKRERGGGGLRFPLSIFLAFSVKFELMRPLLVPLYWTLSRLATNINLIKDQAWLKFNPV